MAQTITFGKHTFSIKWDTPEDLQKFILAMQRTKEKWVASGNKDPLIWVKGRE